MNGAKLKVVYVVGELLRGGTERIVYDILSRLDKERYEPFVCCTSSPGLESEHRKFAAAGITTTFVPCNRGFRRGGLDGVLRLRRYLKEGMFHIVHTHGVTNNLYARFAAVLANSPIIMTYDHDPVPYTWADRALWTFLNLRTARNVAISETVRRYRIRVCPSCAAKTVTIHNGIDLSAFSPVAEQEKRNIRAQLGLPIDSIIIGTVGRLVPSKRHYLFLDAVPLLFGKGQDLHFVIVGEGPEREHLQRKAAEMNLSRRVHFMGWRDDLARMYQVMDIFVLASIPEREGFGLVSAEAMACEKPIVAVNHLTNREVITGECGIFVEPSPEAIAQGILSLLQDEERRTSMGRRGRKRVESHFDIGHTVRKVAALYEEAASGRLRLRTESGEGG